MKTLLSTIDLDGILARLQAPSCAEREAEVSPQRLTQWANRQTAQGYRHNRDSLEALRLYLAGYGLFIFGEVGSGKTYFFKTLGEVLKRENRSFESPVVYPMMDTVGRKVADVREFFHDTSDRDLVLDDIGAEPTFNEYGNRWDILPWLLEMRLAATGRTHFTTNLSGEELQARYGVRTVDRLHEMAADVVFAGKSKRTTKPNISVVRGYVRAQRELDARKAAISTGNAAPGQSAAANTDINKESAT